MKIQNVHPFVDASFNAQSAPFLKMHYPIMLERIMLFFAIDILKCFLSSCSFGLLTHSLFISSIIMHHAQCF